MQSEKNDGATHVRCPGCGHPKTVLLAVGQQLQCDICRTVFFAPVVGSNDVATPEIDEIALETDPVHCEPALPDAATKTMALPSDADLPHATDAETAPPSKETFRQDERSAKDSKPFPKPDAHAPDTSPIGARQVEPIGSSKLPKSAQAEPQGGPPPKPSKTPFRWWGLLVPVAVIVLFAVGTVAAVVLFRIVVGDEPDASSTASGGKTAERRADPEPLVWSDAAKFSQRLAKIVVKVKHIRYGSVTAKDKKNRVIATDNDHLLLISLQVRNRSREPRSFRSWYGTTFTDVAGDPLLAELSDDRGEYYALLDFEDVSRIEGQHYGDEIDAGETVHDAVVFLIPPETDRDSIKYFRLKLPAAAVNAPGFFCFQIPVSMIDQF